MKFPKPGMGRLSSPVEGPGADLQGSEHYAVQKGQRHLRAQDTGLAFLRESQGQKLEMSVCPVLVQLPRGSVAGLRGWDNYP